MSPEGPNPWRGGGDGYDGAMRSSLAPLFFAILLVLTLAAALPAPEAYGDDEPAAAEPAKQADPDAALDTVILQNGSVWKGRIIKEDERTVVVEHTSKSGGIARYTFPRAEVKQIRRAEGVARSPDEGPRPIRAESFLLRRGGRLVGTRYFELWSVRTRGKPGYRLEEKIEFFSQGPQLPATRTHRTEEVNQRFEPRLLAWHEEGDGGGGGRRYSRDVSGRVVDGVWRGSVYSAGEARQVQVRVPEGIRSRLGHREHLLRIPRRVRLIDARILDVDRERLVSVRAGFTSVTEDPSGKRPGHEFHWEEGGRRLISFFDAGQRVVREEISEGIVAVPVSREQMEAARKGTTEKPDSASREVRLAEAGLTFTPPDAIWRWSAVSGSPGHTGWRVLGRLDNRVLLTDMRVEWHPQTATSERSPERVEAWLLRRLRGVSPDLEVVAARTPVDGLEGAWRIGLKGTLKKESIRTTAVVVDRGTGRVVLLLAGPAGAWEQVQPALERLLASIHTL